MNHSCHCTWMTNPEGSPRSSSPSPEGHIPTRSPFDHRRIVAADVRYHELCSRGVREQFPGQSGPKMEIAHRRKQLAVDLDQSTDSLILLNEIKASMEVDAFDLEPYHSIDDEEVLAQIPKTLFTKLLRLISRSIQEGTPLPAVESRILEIVGSAQHDVYLSSRIYGRIVYLGNRMCKDV